jgi:hypothetical protein
MFTVIIKIADYCIQFTTLYHINLSLYYNSSELDTNLTEKAFK